MDGTGRWVGAAWCVAMLGCGGAVAAPLPSGHEPDAGADVPFDYERDETSALTVTGVETSESVAVSCDRATDVRVRGGCELSYANRVTGGALFVEDAAAGANGWTCAASTTEDGVTLKAWVDCERR